MVTDGRVKELRRLLGMGRTLADSARMAEMSEKTARTYRDDDGLPLLVSLYVVTKKKSQYYFTWFGMEKNAFMESVDLYLAILLTAIGCVVACQTLWRSRSGLSVPAVSRAGWLFLTSYVVMFLVSRLHSFDGIIDNASQRFEVAPYGVPFVLGIVFFFWIHFRRRSHVT